MGGTPVGGDEAGEVPLRDIAPNEPPDLVAGALGARQTALGAIALALGESDWLPVVARPA
jgi:hypothetical protein